MTYKQIKDKINEYMEQYSKSWAFSGSIAAIKGGEILFSKAYGYANVEHKVENTTKTKFKIWSITKQFTAAAILILEERGLLSVEDSLKKYFPNCVHLSNDITIHHLLTHTSGIYNYSNLLNSMRTFQRIHHEKVDLIDMFTSQPLDFKPGTQWNYSNSGYYLLGMLIEKISGKLYSEFLIENIFQPLVMLNTGVDDERKIIVDKASGYYLNNNDLIHCNYINMNLIYSSGAMYSTAEDLLIWDQALNSNKLLNSASIDKMNTPYMNSYGYGVSISINDNKRIVHHNGGSPGFIAEIHRHIDDDFAVVVLSNYEFSAVSKLCSVIASIAFGKSYSMPVRPEVFPLNNDMLEMYLGKYEVENFKMELKTEDNNLLIIMDDEYTLPVYSISKSVLHHTWIDEEYPIEMGDDGQVYLWGVKKK